MFGIFLSQQLQNPYLDGASSILIGLILLLVATFLARESKGLLLGESASADVMVSLEKILKRNINIKDWAVPQTMHFGPENIFAVIEIDLADDLKLIQAEQTMESLRLEIKNKIPEIRQVVIQTSNDFVE